MQLRRGGLDPIGAKQAYYQYYLAHPGEDAGAYQPLHPTEEFNGIISTGYAQAQAESGAANLGGLALGAATTNGVIFEAMSGYGGNAALGVGVALVGTIIYKGGRPSPSNLTPRPKDVASGGLSFWDSPERPYFAEQDEYFGIDVAKLRELTVSFDDEPLGHVSVAPRSVTELIEWAATKGTNIIHRFTLELRDAVVIRR